MSVALEAWVDAGVGETREVLARNGAPTAIRVLRASAAGRRALWGEAYCGRVREIDRRRRGAYVDLGLGEEVGFLPLRADGEAQSATGARVAMHVGAAIVVEVAREAARDKNPVVRLRAPGAAGEAPRRIERPRCDSDLDQGARADHDTREAIEAAIEAALAPVCPIPGGGRLTIEPTAALVAVDVDAAGRVGASDPERFAFELNLAAAHEAARQIRLRSLGGIVAIDFVTMRAKAQQRELEQAVRAAFAGDPWSVQFGAMSRFGVFELARAQLRTPLHEILLDRDGRSSAETLALKALREIERELEAQPGRRVECTVSPAVLAWLEQTALDWRAQLAERIGVRWSVRAAAEPAWPLEKIEVRAQ